ncbi:MAG: FAD-dependent oxidoreductase, partial [Lachnospiraceae bacterium]|nr:FAD-dependent oxidoreductase [Lachnospiraceae bacterium]
MKKKIVIIGAGPAGITAAYELLRDSEKYEVIILEASDQVGGISRTVRHGENRIDIGGHRFFSKDDRVMEWWRGILDYQGAPSKDDKLLGRESRLVPGGPDPEKTDDVFLIRHRVSRIYYKGKFFEYPISFKPQTFINMGFGTSLKAGFSYLASCFHKLPETSLENFYINRFGKQLYSMFFEGYTEKVWGRHPRAISAEWGAQRVKGLSIWALVTNVFKKVLPGNAKKVETSLIEEFYYPKLGPGQLWEKALSEAQSKGAEVHFGAKVTKIETENNRIIKVWCEDGNGYAADEVISSMPLIELIASLQAGEADIRIVTPEILRIADGLPYRDFVTVGLLVDRLAITN